MTRPAAPAPAPDAPRWGCTGKKAFTRFCQARRAAKVLNRNDDHAHVEAYHCRHCQQFHIGSRDWHGKRRPVAVFTPGDDDEEDVSGRGHRAGGKRLGRNDGQRNGGPGADRGAQRRQQQPPGRQQHAGAEVAQHQAGGHERADGMEPKLWSPSLLAKGWLERQAGAAHGAKAPQPAAQQEGPAMSSLKSERKPVTPATALDAAMTRLDKAIASAKQDISYHEEHLAQYRQDLADLEQEKATMAEFMARTLPAEEVRP